MPMPVGGRKKKAVEGSQRDNAWRCIRVHKRFTIVEIMVSSGCSRDNLNRYLPWLVKEGYLAMEGRQCKPGQAGSYNKYKLIKDSIDTPVMSRRV